MENKTYVRVKDSGYMHGEYIKGEGGYIDGYLNIDDSICAIVVMFDRIQAVPIKNLEVISIK